jgi:hypothetical protein
VVLGQDGELGTLHGCGSDEFRGFVEVVLKLEWLRVLMLAKHGRQERALPRACCTSAYS